MTDISPLNVRGLLAQATAQGPGVADDTAITATGRVLETDVSAGRVRVSIRGGEVWIPAVAGRYSAASLVRVLLDATSARPVLALGPVTPRAPVELGTVTGTGGGTVTVVVAGDEVTVPAPLGTYTVGQSAWVMLDGWGRPMIAVGPSTTPSPDAPPSGGGGGGSSTEVATVTIAPQTSGTWRSGYGWDSWNGSRYGGLTNVYQGNRFGSGLLIGFAGYGNQVENLGAVSIEEMILTVRKNDTNGLSAALAVQATASATRPGGSPVAGPYGSASTPTIGPGAWGSVALPAGMREAFRTGDAKGLVAVGSDYGAFGGTATPGSFTLKIRYTKST